MMVRTQRLDDGIVRDLFGFVQNHQVKSRLAASPQKSASSSP